MSFGSLAGKGGYDVACFRSRRAGHGRAGAVLAHALVAGGARHLLHERAALVLLRARQVRARRARRRRVPGEHCVSRTERRWDSATCVT